MPLRRAWSKVSCTCVASDAHSLLTWSRCRFPIGLRQSRMVEGLLERAKNGTATPGYACVHKRPEPVCAMGVTVVS